MVSLWPLAFSNCGASSSITDFSALVQKNVISAADAGAIGASVNAAAVAASTIRFILILPRIAGWFWLIWPGDRRMVPA